MTTLSAKALLGQRLTAGGQRRGFTLIELLVVMAVIAILAGILLPVIHIARVQAKTTSTKTLLLQIGGALGRYNEDWGHFPPDDFDLVDGAKPVKFVDYDPDKSPPENLFTPSGGFRATGEALYYYLVNPNVTRRHPYLELQADIQFKNWDYNPNYTVNKLRFVCDAWERPFLYNRPAFTGQTATYFNRAGNPIHHTSTYDLFSVGANGQTALKNLPHPKGTTTEYQDYNDRALDDDNVGNNNRTYGDDNDDIASWK